MSLHPEHVKAMNRKARPHRQAFASNLANLRIRARLKQREVALRVGKPLPTYAKWETGYGAPKLQDIAALCVAVNCTPNELFGWPTVPHLTAIQMRSLGLGPGGG